MTKAAYIASGYCDAAIAKNVPKDTIMTHLEGMLGDEITLISKGDHQEIWLVFDDSRPSQVIYILPKGYK